MKTLFGLLALLYCSSAFAGSGSGKILQLTVHSPSGEGSGVVMFKTEYNENKALCSTTDNGTQWAFSLEDEYGMAMYSMLLAAQVQKTSVTVYGRDNCSAWGDRETPKYIYTKIQ